MSITELTANEADLLTSIGIVEAPNWMNRFMLGATEFTSDDLEEVSEKLNEVIGLSLSIQQKIRKAKK